MPATDICPSAADLERLAHGTLPRADADRLVAHLARCERCAAQVGRLRTQFANTPPAGAHTAQTDPATPAPDAAVPFLDPPRAAGEVGWLTHYRVLKRLGQGGMGLVFLAEDTLLARPVALKVMLPTLAATAANRDRFLREARAAAALTHDHVVTIYQVGEANGAPFLAMQLLQGEPLDGYLNRGRKLTLGHVCRIGRETALGLAAAHAKGLIHRDIKPANLWLEAPKGRVKILDFGLARGADDPHLTGTGMVLGTPSYMAPEQARGMPLDGRCDLWSLGVVLYRLGAGRLPFTGKEAFAVLTSIAIDEPPPLVQVAPDTPAELSELVAQLLAKEPDKRPESARAVADRLLKIERTLAGAKTVVAPQTGTGETATPTPPAPPSTPTKEPTPPPVPVAAPRKRWPLVAAAAALAGLLIAGAAWVFRGGTDPDRGGHAVARTDPPKPPEPVPVPPNDPPPVWPADPPAGSADAVEDVIVDPGPAEPVPTGTPLPWHATLGGHRLAVNYLAYAAGGRALVSADKTTAILRDGTFGHWTHWLNGAALGVPTEAAKEFALAPDGKTLAVAAHDGRESWLVLRDVAGSAESVLQRGPGASVTGLAWSPDGLFLASGHKDGRVVLWDAAGRKEQAQFTDHAAPVRALAFAPKGGRWASGDADAVGKVVVREGASRTPVGMIGTGAPVTSLAFTPDGLTLVTHSRDAGLLQRWDVVASQRRGEPSLHGKGGRMALSPDGRFAAVSYSAGRGKAGARLVELATWQTKLVTDADHDGALSAVAWSPDGYTLATAGPGGDRNIKLWDVSRLTAPTPPPPPPIVTLTSRKQETGLTSTPLVLEFVNGGRTLAVADRDHVWLRDAASGVYRPAQAFGPALQRAYKGTVAHAAVAPDGKTLALAVHDDAPGATPRLVLWDLVAGKERGTLPTSLRYDALAFRPDGQILATGTAEDVRLWDLTRPLAGSRVQTRAEAKVTALAFAPAGTALAIGKADGAVRLWDPAQDRVLWSSVTQGNAAVQGLTFSPDGRWLVATTLDQGFVRIWNAKTGQVQHNVSGMGQRLAFSPDGRLLATGSIALNGTENRRVDVFDVEAKRVAARSAPNPVAHTNFIAAVAFSADGRTLVTGGSDKVLKFWDVPALPR